MTWRERLARAAKEGGFTHLDDEKDSDGDMAGGWTTCYVGEHHGGKDVMTLESYLTPTYKLGMQFCDAVQENDVAEAIRIADALDALWAGERP